MRGHSFFCTNAIATATIAGLLLAASDVRLASAASFCTNFNDGTGQGWTIRPDAISFTNVPASSIVLGGPDGSKYLQSQFLVFATSGGLTAAPTLTGPLACLQASGQVEFDFKVFNDGDPTMIRSITPQLVLAVNDPPLRAVFTSTITVQETTPGWVHLTAPLVAGASLPPPSLDGTWSWEISSPGYDWNFLVHNAVAMWPRATNLRTDPFPIVGIDNFCVTVDAPTVSGTSLVQGIVFDDQDGDGSRDTGEPVMPGVLVSLTGSLGSLTYVRTDALGVYQFSGAANEIYTVSAVPSADWIVSGPVSLTHSYSVKIQYCQRSFTGLDFGMHRIASQASELALSHRTELTDRFLRIDVAPATAQPDTVWLGDYSFDGCNTMKWGSGGKYASGHLVQSPGEGDACTGNTTCAWLFTPQTGNTACVPSQRFGPGSEAVRPDLDEFLVSPWISFASTPGANGTVLSYRTFPGNSYDGARVVTSAWVRGKTTLTGGAGDIFDDQPWRIVDGWTSNSLWQWATATQDLTSQIDPASRYIQVMFRVANWGPQGLGVSAAGRDCGPGPGPYIDRLRIGRRVIVGPTIDVGVDTRSQAQDAFPTVRNTIAPGEHYSPGNGIFGTCAFSSGEDLGAAGRSAQLITADSVHVHVADLRNAGGLNHVRLYGRITSGPHAGKTPPGTTAQGEWFFIDATQGAPGEFAADLDDDYFRGGDVLEYAWYATDMADGGTSMPPGLTGPDVPGTVAEARTLTRGLYEVSFLPSIEWDPDYLAAIQLHPTGKLDPFDPAHPEWRDQGMRQRACMLYVQMIDSERRSGDLHRTSMMHTLDWLGYRGAYDVYDIQGFGNTNNHLAGRANPSQVEGYALVIQDTGRRRSSLLPVAQDPDAAKLDQGAWYRSWLASAASHQPWGRATLWLIGENLVEEAGLQPLLATDASTVLVPRSSLFSAYNTPDVTGTSAFQWDNGAITNFQTEPAFAVGDGCGRGLSASSRIDDVRGDVDEFAATGSAVLTHRYRDNSTNGAAIGGAIVMRSQAAAHWNTVVMGFPWDAIADVGNTLHVPSAAPPDSGRIRLARNILSAAIPPECSTCAEMPGDLLAWWRADGDAKDTWAGHGGTLRNGATFGPGRVGQAFALDGVDDFVEVTNTAELNPAAFTVEAWIYPTARGFNRCVFAHGNSCHLPRSWDISVATDGTVWMFFSPDGVTDIDFGSSVPVPLNQWSHIGVTFAAGVLTLYVDGVATGTHDFGAALNQNSANLRIGAFYCNFGDALGRPFAGRIDEVGYYDRALTASEIAAVYQAAGSGKCLPATTDVQVPIGTDVVPPQLALYPNVPNPFNPSTLLTFDLPQAGSVHLSVYDIAGRQLQVLVDQPLQPGRHEVRWNGVDAQGARAATGVYLAVLRTGNGTVTRKMVVLK